MHTFREKFFDYCVSCGKKVSFLTNGLLINDEWARKIALHSTFVYFSVNAATKIIHEFINRGSSWDKVLENVQAVRRYKEEFGTDIDIIGHMTIVPANLAEIPHFIVSYGEMGFDSFDFSYIRTLSVYLKQHAHQKEALRRTIKEALRAVRLRQPSRMNSLRQLGLA